MTTISGVHTGSARQRVRIGAAVLSGVVAALYVGVFFVQLPHIHELDNPAPIYLFLAALYAVGALVVALTDKAALHWLGAALQAVLIALFVWLLRGLYAHGEESFITDMAGLAIAVNVCQVALLGVLAYLGITASPSVSEEAAPPGAGS
jgi:hypothetical protein